jgi:hypothetical protein
MFEMNMTFFFQKKIKMNMVYYMQDILLSNDNNLFVPGIKQIVASILL